MNRLAKVMRFILIYATAIVFLIACGNTSQTTETTESANGDSASQVEDGTYEGSTKGYNEDINVKITLENGEITEVQSEHEETPTIGGEAITALSEEVVNNQSINIDTVSGATVSSEAFLAALAAALEASGASLDSFNPEVSKESKEVTDEETDVVIIGAGGAGLTAAIEAGS